MRDRAGASRSAGAAAGETPLRHWLQEVRDDDREGVCLQLRAIVELDVLLSLDGAIDDPPAVEQQRGVQHVEQPNAGVTGLREREEIVDLLEACLDHPAIAVPAIESGPTLCFIAVAEPRIGVTK